MSESNPDPFPFRCQARIWAVGRWGQGGTVLLRDGALNGQINLPPGEFDLLAVLLLAAQRALPGAAWAPTGCLTTEELCRELTRRAKGTPNLLLADPEGVVKTVYRVRKRIVQALFPQGKGAEYSKQLLETIHLGYRIGVPADHINLVMLGQSDAWPPVEPRAGDEEKRSPGDPPGMEAGPDLV
jgi:hypothetical protein